MATASELYPSLSPVSLLNSDKDCSNGHCDMFLMATTRCLYPSLASCLTIKLGRRCGRFCDCPLGNLCQLLRHQRPAPQPFSLTTGALMVGSWQQVLLITTWIPASHELLREAKFSKREFWSALPFFFFLFLFRGVLGRKRASACEIVGSEKVNGTERVN